MLFTPLDIKANPPALFPRDESTILMQLETFVYQFQASEDRNLSLFVSHILNLFVHNSNALSPEIDFDVHELVKMVNFYL